MNGRAQPCLFGTRRRILYEERAKCVFLYGMPNAAVHWQQPSSDVAVFQLLLNSEVVKCFGMIKITPETVTKTFSRKSIHRDSERESFALSQKLQREK